MTEIRRRTAAGLKEGDVFEVKRTFTKQCTLDFADLSQDYNPIHFEKRFTDLKGFDEPICHGLLVGGMITEIGGQIGMLASGMNFRFRRPVYFGETITCRLTIDEMDANYRVKCSADITNEAGEAVIEAQLFGIVPGPPEQEVLKAMMREGDPSNKLRSE